MKKIAMAVTMMVLAAAPVTAQQAEHHADMQEMHEVMVMMHHPEMLDLSEAQVQRLEALMERVHADGMPHMQGPEAMSALVEEARGILTVEQRERLDAMDHSMDDRCPMMKHDEHDGHGPH